MSEKAGGIMEFCADEKKLMLKQKLKVRIRVLSFKFTFVAKLKGGGLKFHDVLFKIKKMVIRI